MKKVFDNFNYMICEHKAQANDNKHFNNNTNAPKIPKILTVITALCVCIDLTSIAIVTDISYHF